MRDHVVRHILNQNLHVQPRPRLSLPAPKAQPATPSQTKFDYAASIIPPSLVTINWREGESDQCMCAPSLAASDPVQSSRGEYFGDIRYGQSSLCVCYFEPLITSHDRCLLPSKKESTSSTRLRCATRGQTRGNSVWGSFYLGLVPVVLTRTFFTRLISYVRLAR